MRKLLSIFLTATLCTLVLASCRSESPVQAGREGEDQTYEPLPGTGRDDTGATREDSGATAPGQAGSMEAQEVQGTLERVNPADNTIVVRSQDGTEHTFKFTGQTSVMQGQGAPMAQPSIQDLANQQGSQVTVRWTQEGSDKVATSVQLSGAGGQQQQQQQRSY